MIEKNKFYHCDCMELMKQMPDKYIDLAIVDPPYGINIQKSGRLKRYNTKSIWDNQTPKKEYFKELFRVSKNQIIWGGNYFELPPTRCFVIWDKRQPEDISFASCEFGWTSFEESAKTFYFSPLADKNTRIHTTQKPVALYEWLLNRYAKQGDLIFDSHCGSASSLVACHRLGFEYIGCEIDEEYYKMANERLEAEKAQLRLL